MPGIDSVCSRIHSTLDLRIPAASCCGWTTGVPLPSTVSALAADFDVEKIVCSDDGPNSTITTINLIFNPNAVGFQPPPSQIISFPWEPKTEYRGIPLSSLNWTKQLTKLVTLALINYPVVNDLVGNAASPLAEPPSLINLAAVGFTLYDNGHYSGSPLSNSLQALSLENSSSALTSLDVREFPELETLSLRGCSKDLSSTFTYPPSNKIHYMDLARNHISRIDFPTDASLTIPLEHLDISANMVYYLPPSLFAACSRTLVYLDTANNILGARDYNTSNISVISYLSNVQHLDISSNNFVGPVPKAWFSSLRNLRYINLNHNSITGDVPDLSGTMVSYVNIANNYFTVDVTLPPGLLIPANIAIYANHNCDIKLPEDYLHDKPYSRNTENLIQHCPNPAPYQEGWDFALLGAGLTVVFGIFALFVWLDYELTGREGVKLKGGDFESNRFMQYTR